MSGKQREQIQVMVMERPGGCFISGAVAFSEKITRILPDIPGKVFKISMYLFWTKSPIISNNKNFYHKISNN